MVCPTCRQFVGERRGPIGRPAYNNEKDTNIVRSLRLKYDLTREEFCRMANLPLETLKKWENAGFPRNAVALLALEAIRERLDTLNPDE